MSPQVKTALITQSNYLPWKGYFDLINSADEFVVYDDMQFTKRDWRSRNRIKTAQGLKWLSIPIRVAGRFTQKIRDAKVSDPGWARKHWAAISRHYAQAPYFNDYAGIFEELYRGSSEYLSAINLAFIEAVCKILGITTRIRSSSEFALAEERTQRLVDICKNLGAARYVTGPTAKAYMREELFLKEGIEVRYFDYHGYPPYRQLYGDFVHEVSIIDLIFNEGPQARVFMKSFADSSCA